MIVKLNLWDCWQYERHSYITTSAVAFSCFETVCAFQTSLTCDGSSHIILFYFLKFGLLSLIIFCTETHRLSMFSLMEFEDVYFILLWRAESFVPVLLSSLSLSLSLHHSLKSSQGQSGQKCSAAPSRLLQSSMKQRIQQFKAPAWMSEWVSG